jgi:hypothetical protein
MSMLLAWAKHLKVSLQNFQRIPIIFICFFCPPFWVARNAGRPEKVKLKPVYVWSQEHGHSLTDVVRPDNVLWLPPRQRHHQHHRIINYL